MSATERFRFEGKEISQRPVKHSKCFGSLRMVRILSTFLRKIIYHFILEVDINLHMYHVLICISHCIHGKAH